jgi:DNA-binding transcriptional MerR regulator
VGDQGAKLARGRFNEYFRRISAGGRLATAGDTFGRASPLPPRKLYRVSEIADHLGVTRQTIHNYATIGLITEEDRTPGGQRLFDESVFMRLLFIQRMKHTHRLTEIRHVLEGRTPLPEIDIQPREPGEHIAAAPLTPAARGMLERMQELASIAHRDEPQIDAAPLAVPENAQREGHTSTQQRVAMPPAPSASSHDSGLLPHAQRTTDEKATEPDAKHPV